MTSATADPAGPPCRSKRQPLSGHCLARRAAPPPTGAAVPLRAGLSGPGRSGAALQAVRVHRFGSHGRFGRTGAVRLT